MNDFFPTLVEKQVLLLVQQVVRGSLEHVPPQIGRPDKKFW